MLFITNFRLRGVADGAVVERATRDGFVMTAVHANGFARGAIPQARGGVRTRGDEIGCVDAKDTIPHPALMTLEHALELEPI